MTKRLHRIGRKISATLQQAETTVDVSLMLKPEGPQLRQLYVQVYRYRPSDSVATITTIIKPARKRVLPCSMNVSVAYSCNWHLTLSVV